MPQNKNKVGDLSGSSASVSSNLSSDIPTDLLSDVPSDILIESRIRYGTRSQMLAGFLMEYSKKSSVHGIRYILQKRRPLVERILWAILFLISLLSSCIAIHHVYRKWLNTPVIVGFDETLIPIHKVPFPTVTICPETKIETDIFNFANVYERFMAENSTVDSLSQEELERLSATLHICDPEVAEKVAANLPKDLAPPIGRTLRSIAISKNVTAPFCKWKRRFYLCENIYSLVATEDGICYQFNGLAPADLYRNESFAMEIPDDIEVDFNKHVDRVPGEPPIQINGTWSVEEGYINQTEESYPLRVLMASAKSSFTSLLQGLGHNLDYTCRSLRQGFKVYLNSPENVVFSSSNYFLVRHKQELVVQIYPVYTTTSKAVREFAAERRQCFFNTERYLRFFNFYSESNCKVECLTNFTIAKCDCVRFYMPRPEGVRVCNHADIACYYEAEDELLMEQQMEITHSLKGKEVQNKCNCKPSCVSLNYNFDISQARMEPLGTILAHNDSYDEHPDFMWSRLTIYFKEQQFTAMKRSELYTFSTLIANCGGLLSLFIGFSILSIVELVYFVTIRLKNSLNKRRNAETEADFKY